MKDKMLECMKALRLKLGYDRRLLKAMRRLVENWPRPAISCREYNPDNTVVEVTRTGEDEYRACLCGPQGETMSELLLRPCIGFLPTSDGYLSTAVMNMQYEILTVDCMVAESKNER